MARIFNATGTCIPEKHFIADISDKLDVTMEMVARGDYFTINRPYQYGKTTSMYLLSRRLLEEKDYLVLHISFEGISASAYSSEERFMRALFKRFKRSLEFSGETELAALIKNQKELIDFDDLSDFLTDFLQEIEKKTVLMIDEVDKSTNNQLFLDFLGMLRTKYLARNEGRDRTFHSVILAGVHDVKNLKAKLRPEEEQKYNSPWNIAMNFEVDLSLFPKEIESMLTDYAAEKNVTMGVKAISEKIFYYTSGYPFLVSYLCKLTDEKLLPGRDKKEWTERDLEEAVQIILKSDNTNFKTLTKNLENNPDLYEYVFSIVMNEREFSFTRDNPLIDFAAIYGMLREDKGKARIHNRVYEQRIFNYMTSKLETSGKTNFYNITESYLDKDGHLDIEKIIRKFQLFMKEQYSEKDSAFIERNGRLLFLAFIKPIINGQGFDFKEVQISEEKRLDVVVTFGNQKFIIELKIWRGDGFHEKGLDQLCDYLDKQNQTKGFLLIFDLKRTSGHRREVDTVSRSNKKIFTAWV